MTIIQPLVVSYFQMCFQCASNVQLSKLIQNQPSKHVISSDFLFEHIHPELGETLPDQG